VHDFSDRSARLRVPLRMYPQTVQSDDFLFRLGSPSNELYYSAYGCFELFYASPRSSYDEPKVGQIYGFIQQVRRNSDTTLTLPSVTALFQGVYVQFLARLIYQIREFRGGYRVDLDPSLESTCLALVKIFAFSESPFSSGDSQVWTGGSLFGGSTGSASDATRRCLSCLESRITTLTNQ